ncbi:polysaccharide deacetylase family protein [Allochromatium palmeri]|uniref:Polysaccharide deacetylase n=1 Tax=Allochromatium palmeri TaxID=231048 RepID=A0A6N8EFS6_9GAMM|nr:polysaccharide deacetylase [Allochromatium palmeri]MTW21204.1 polysaccharide deacetylase [Allochromatium palmeri]
MLDVFFTVDTEIWCGAWDNLDRRFPEAYRRYVYGPTRQGEYGLPMTLRILNDHGLRGVFFVEPLFSLRFGAQPLQELVGLIRDAGHEVQLHLHTEWVDEAPQTPALPRVSQKMQYLRLFNLADQTALIRCGKDLLAGAGVTDPLTAFRAGGFAANLDTLRAVAVNSISFETSYNPAARIGVADIAPGRVLVQPESIAGVSVYPVTVFRDGLRGRLRHLQLTACSFREMAQVLNGAAEAGWRAVVIVSHNFELLNPAKDRRDPIVVRRLQQLCRFLDRHRDRFAVRGFTGLGSMAAKQVDLQPAPLHASPRATGQRYLEQAARRLL